MHILALPKWYPGRHDPQLGDFIRKQMLAVAKQVKVSVVAVVQLEDAPEPEFQELNEQGGAWELCCYYRPDRSASPLIRKARNFLRYRQATLNGIARLQYERGVPDLIHAHILTRPALMARWFSIRWGVPWMLSEQSSVYLNGAWAAKNGWAKALDRSLLRHAARVTAVSPHLGKAMQNLGLCQDAVVVPNVLPGMEGPVPPAGPAHELMLVADLVDRTKNVGGVLRAMADACRQGHALRLTVIGDGEDRMALEELARSLGLAEQVIFLGRLPNKDVLDRMAATGTVVVNSNYETFSVVTGEALALGKPVIATRCGGPEAFITPENGVLVPVGDDAALSKAMQLVSSDRSRYAPAAVRATVSGRFSAAAVAEAFTAIYRSIR